MGESTRIPLQEFKGVGYQKYGVKLAKERWKARQAATLYLSKVAKALKLTYLQYYMYSTRLVLLKVSTSYFHYYLRKPFILLNVILWSNL